jgi:hypothetical protein
MCTQACPIIGTVALLSFEKSSSEKLHGAAAGATRSWINFLLEAAAECGSRRCKVRTKDVMRSCAHLDSVRID